MTFDELQTELSVLLSFEEDPPIDWEAVERRSHDLCVRLSEPDTPLSSAGDGVMGYLAGFNRRRVDPEFASHQQQWLRSYLRS